MSYQVYKEYLRRYYDEMNQNKMFVVAYFSQHTGALDQKLIYAKDSLSALNKYLDSDYASAEALDEAMVGSDSWISSLEINDTMTE